MTWLDLALVAGLLLALGAAVALAVVLRRERHRAGAEVAASRADAAALRERVDRLESRLPSAGETAETARAGEAAESAESDDAEGSYVITALGDREPAARGDPAHRGRGCSPTWCCARRWCRRPAWPTASAARCHRRTATGSASS